MIVPPTILILSLQKLRFWEKKTRDLKKNASSYCVWSKCQIPPLFSGPLMISKAGLLFRSKNEKNSPRAVIAFVSIKSQPALRAFIRAECPFAILLHERNGV